MSPVLGYEGKDDDWKPKSQLRRCSSERSQAQIEPEVSANGNNQGRQNPEAGWVWWARQEQRVSSRLLQSQLQERWCYHWDDAHKTGSRDSAQQLRVLPGVIENPVQFPEFMWGSSHEPVTPAPGHPAASSDFSGHLHTCDKHSHTHK